MNSLSKLNGLSADELSRLVVLQRELQTRIKQNPLKYFWPHQRNCDGTQCDTATLSFHTFDGKEYTVKGCPQFKFLNSLADTRAFFGANRSGKTTSGVIEVSHHTTGQYPDWWKGRKWLRPVKGRLFCSDFSKGAKVLTEKLHEWLPRDSIISVDKNNLKAEVGWNIRHKTGGTSYFDILTYEQDPYLAEGWNGDFALFDEPPPRDMYIATVRGLIDNDGICLFTLTPLKEPWLFDEIYNSKDKKIFSVIADMRHNTERMNPLSHQLVGLKEDAIRKFESKLTEEERETRMHGKFRYLAGRIWKEWDREVHTFDRRIWMANKDNVVVDGEPPKHWPRMMLIDPHDRNPHAIIWVACDETMNFKIYREAWLENMTIPEIVKYIKQVEIVSRETIQTRIMDPNFGPKRYGNTGLTVRDEFEKAGRDINYPVRFNFGDDHKEIARKTVAQLLKYDINKPLSLLNHPILTVADDLKELIYQVEHYVWDEFRSGVDRDPKEKPKDINTHFPDLLSYFSLAKFSWHKPKIHQGTGSFYL